MPGPLLASANMVSTPGTRKAVITEKPGKVSVLEMNMPQLGPKNALVKTTMVAFNPIDQTCVDYWSQSGCVVGCEFSGIVEEVGDDLDQDLQPGDRVCGFAHGCKADSMDVLSQLFTDQAKSLSHEHGAFASHVIATGGICMKIPPHMSDTEAATLPVGMLSAATSLYWLMKFPFPDNPMTKRKPLFIYGGSSSTGVYAIQLAKLSGAQVICTASAKNLDYVKSLGADLVFDYNSPTLVQDVRRSCPMISYIIDTVCRDDLRSQEICSKIMCLAGGTYVPTFPVVKSAREDIHTATFTTFSAFGEKFSTGPYEIPVVPDYHEWCKKWYEIASKLINEDKIKPYRHRLLPDGLEGVARYIKVHREGNRISGYKPVFEAL